MVVARCSCCTTRAQGSYFSPRMVIFWCSHQSLNYTPDQYNLRRVDRHQPMPQEMKVKDFWIHHLLPQEHSCPQSYLESLPCIPARGTRLRPQIITQGLVLGYISPTHHTTAQRQRSSKLGWVSKQLQVSCFLCWAQEIISTQSVNLQATHMHQDTHPFISSDR